MHDIQHVVFLLPTSIYSLPGVPLGLTIPYLYSPFLRTVPDQCPCVAPFLIFTPDLVLALLCLWGSNFFWEVLLLELHVNSSYLSE